MKDIKCKCGKEFTKKHWYDKHLITCAGDWKPTPDQGFIELFSCIVCFEIKAEKKNDQCETCYYNFMKRGN